MAAALNFPILINGDPSAATASNPFDIFSAQGGSLWAPKTQTRCHPYPCLDPAMSRGRRTHLVVYEAGVGRDGGGGREEGGEGVVGLGQPAEGAVGAGPGRRGRGCWGPGGQVQLLVDLGRLPLPPLRLCTQSVPHSDPGSYGYLLILLVKMW